MKYQIKHITEYRYSDPVQLCHNEARLQPRATAEQSCLSSRLEISPTPAVLHTFNDYFGNRVAHFALQQAHDLLRVTALSEVQVNAAANDLAVADEQSWEEVRAFMTSDGVLEQLDVMPCCYNSPLVKKSRQLQAYAAPSFTPGRPFGQAVQELTERIFDDFTYDLQGTTIATPLSEVLQTRRGVCQDFAQLAIGCLRSIGLSARYVSGYIETLPPPGQQRLIGADASHAWFATYSPRCGWIAFDPTNNKRQGEQHITVAWGRDYADVSPLKGVALGGGTHTVTVSVDVARQTLCPEEKDN